MSNAQSNPLDQFLAMFQDSMGRLVEHNSVTGLVRNELRAQDDRWGEQNHPVLPDNGWDWVTQGFYYTEAEKWKERNDARVEFKKLAWDGVLLEEVFEALSETDPRKQQEELIQVAAVALQMVMSIRRAEKAKADALPIQQAIDKLDTNMKRAAERGAMPSYFVSKDGKVTNLTSERCSNPYCSTCNPIVGDQ